MSNNDIKNGINTVKKHTQFQARLQLVNKKPIVFADAAHNEAGVKNLLKYLSQFGFENITFVLGFVKDKNIENILKILPKNAYYIATEPSIYRKLPYSKLSELMTKENIEHNTDLSVNFALNFLLKRKEKNRIICVTGSSFMVSDTLALFQTNAG